MAGSIAYPVRAPQWILTYEGVNISADISAMVLGITYMDRVGGAASEIEIVLEDHEKLWQGPWYPRQGDVTNLLMGYQAEPLLPCGDFQVDEIELEGPPDVFRIRCLSAYITPPMRTRRSAAYEGRTLGQIAQTIATLYRLTLVITAKDPDPVYARITQKNETDLEFLRRLADEQGYEFSIRGRQLVFYPRAALDQIEPVMTIQRSEVLAFAFANKTHRTYKAAQIDHQQPSTKKLLSGASSGTPNSAVSDTLKLQVRCENAAQANVKADAALRRANMSAATARLELEGSTNLCAGNAVIVGGFGISDGAYMLQSSRHRLTRGGGYTTEVEARRIN